MVQAIKSGGKLTAAHRGDSMQISQNWPTKPNGYQLGNVIGMGNFGIVWSAQCVEGQNQGQTVAIKVLDCAQFEDSSLNELRRESAIMNTSRHRNIVSEHVSFIHGNFLWIVMQIVDAGSCTDIMSRMKVQSGVSGIRDESIIATILRETMHGLRYLHSNAKIHRDIKGGNILMNMQGEVLLTDFGVSAQMKKGVKQNTVCGSPCWMAPEVMQEQGHDTSADIWSLGITAIELALGDAPLSQYPHMKVIRLILDQSPPSLPNQGWTDEFKAFVHDCLKKNPSERPSIEELLTQHTVFLNKAQDTTYLQQNFLAGLPPLEQRLRPELVAHGDDFLQQLQLSKKRPKKSRANFDFGSGEDRRDEQKAQAKAEPQQAPSHTHLAATNHAQPKPATDDFDFGLGEDEY